MNGYGYEQYNSYNDYDKHENQIYFRRPSLIQFIAISLVSAIIGGLLMFGGIVFSARFSDSAIGLYIQKFIPENAKIDVNNQNNLNPGSHQNIDPYTYKKVEIIQSNSPVSEIYEKVSPSVVGIRITAPVQDFIFGYRQVPGEGSGIIIRSDGYILTNNHVIEPVFSQTTGRQITNAKIEVFLPGKLDKPYAAKVIGRDPKTDLAVIKIDAKNLPAAELGDSDKIRVGELAVAIGNPGGLQYMSSVTAGIISGINRTIKTEDGKDLTLIQTDAAINPGNSGGALVNSKGQVIGVNTIKIVQTGFEGLGFAIPINKAKEISNDLINYTFVKNRPRLGVYIDQRFTEEVAKRYDVPMGLLVSDVEPLSAAYKAGIRPNDIIVGFDGQEVKTFDKLEELKNKHKPGDKVMVKIYRDGKTFELEVTLGEDTGPSN